MRKDTPSSDYVVGWSRGVTELHDWLYKQERVTRRDLDDFLKTFDKEGA